MKLFIKYIVIGLLFSSSCFSQTWSGCGKGFFYPPTALYSDPISNKLYACGFVFNVDGKQMNSVASWDGTKWDSLGHGALGAYDEFLIRYKNKLYLQRFFNVGGGITHIYAWDFNTQLWDSLPNGYVGGTIKRACIDDNGDLILVGQFNKIGSTTMHNIARFDGTTFYPVGFPTFSIYISSIAVYKNEIYIGGNFNDTIHGGIAKWNGSQWVDLNHGFVSGGPEVVSLIVYHNRLYAAGSFIGTKEKYMPSIAAWDGTQWNDIGGIYNHNFPWGVVYNMFEFQNKLFVGGGFDRAGNLDVNNMAIWNDTNWCSMNTVFESPISISAIYQNKIYLGRHYKIDNDSVAMLGYYVGSNYIDSCETSRIIIKPEQSNFTEFSIYPNPTSSVLNITGDQSELENATIEITNSLGQSVMSIPYAQSIDVSGLSNACYFLRITTSSNQVLRAKFIKG